MDYEAVIGLETHVRIQLKMKSSVAASAVFG
jgi:hypothetical protein